MRPPTLIRLICALAGCSAPLAAPAEWPAPGAVYDSLREHLPEIRPPASGETNTLDYLHALAPEVLIGRASEADKAAPPVTRTNVYADGIGYLRVGRVVADLSHSLSNALLSLHRSNAASRLVVDLRFATGWDFEAALGAAGLFASKPVDGFQLGDRPLLLPAAAGAEESSLMILINRSTRGAAELLASALRQVSFPSLLIGTNTAGLAAAYAELSIPDAGVLRVRERVVILPGDRPFPTGGLAPDLVVPVAESDEALYFADEYGRVVEGHRLPPDIAARMNEAELVRRRRGLRPALEPAPPTSRQVQDPVLARALDLLEGLADLAAKQSKGDSR
jgi:hypothetical protein